MNRFTADTAGKVLGALYRALGMSQRQFAKLLADSAGKNFDGTKAQLWTWESGTRRPDLASYEAALRPLGLGLAIVPLGDENETAHSGHYGAPSPKQDQGFLFGLDAGPAYEHNKCIWPNSACIGHAPATVRHSPDSVTEPERCKNCRATIEQCNESGCGQRKEPGWRTAP